jgi:glutamyl-tRNA synthetase
MVPRVRFAPSPTGYLHVGGARTALFNWLYARGQGGVFVLRIEDTDVERSSWEMVKGILDGMRWLGLDWDEGPEVGGSYGPYFQSERLDRYRAMADELVQSGHAYYCYCSPEMLKARREAASGADAAEGWTYDRACTRLSAEEIARHEAAGTPRAIRFRVPEGHTSFDDLVHGRVDFDNAHIEDFVVLRSDLNPTYHLSVVVDDLDMAITHVVRGDDHISNTPKQALLYGAFGRPLPLFAHVPLILGPEQTARRDVGHGVPASRVLAGGDGQFPRPARLVAWQRPGDLHARRSRTRLLARRHQQQQRGVQSREARLDEQPAHCADEGRGDRRASAAVAR